MHSLNLQLGKKRFPVSCLWCSLLRWRFGEEVTTRRASKLGRASHHGGWKLPRVFSKQVLLLTVVGGCAEDLKSFLAEVLGLYVTAKTFGNIFA